MRKMTNREFRQSLPQIGLATQGEAAAFFDLSLRTINGYANDVPVPTSIAMLVRLMVRFNLKPDDLE